MNPIDRIDQLTKEKHSMEIAALKLADDYDALKSDIASVTAERDHWIALYKERNKTAAILEDTSIALRARVAELVAALREIAEETADDQHETWEDVAVRLVQKADRTIRSRVESAAPAKDEGVSNE